MRRHRRKVGNKEKVFGCDLVDHLTTSSQEVPLVLQCCSEFVEKNGIVDGIYRLSGVSSIIQKLRGEFESEGSPDLNKDVYLQDIHCVSSLCKAYFRELPNPLLTYQLYDKFAEAVAIQLEEERLVKIRDVLKELPAPHHRTLEFLMRHLVRMASYSSETNMHARNLAIVWAPNLLRSKDIEVSGFNGTAAFMEVRVQSIVVEFILTHVPQLFPEQGHTSERRSSLPFPTAASCREEGPLKLVPSQPIQNFGNISPGDGPPSYRSYHAIIEGTDKRKGSLKGRKWMSIFNIGGRFPDPRRRHKHSAKEKDRPTLRPARSMDSLSTSPYPNEGSRRPTQRPPSTTSSTPVIAASSQAASDVSASTGGLGGSEYAVTYRRGTGLVSGGAGTQGTYTALDPEGLGATGSETIQSRSPGLSTKVGRRAAMHITGPTTVTVPLHITSNLALGVLQGGGADRVIHRGRVRGTGDKAEGKEEKERKASIAMERNMEQSRKAENEEMNHKVIETDKEKVIEAERGAEEGGDEEEEGKGKEEDEGRDFSIKEPVLVKGGGGVSWEKRAKSLTSNKGEDGEEHAVHEDIAVEDEYMDMKDVILAELQPEGPQNPDVFDSSEFLNSTNMEGDDLGLSGYVQDNFEFLDQMDCSVMDHMDCGVSYQVNEFSVEPPGHSDDEYEVMEQYHISEEHTHQQHDPETQPQSPTELNTHRSIRLDSQSRHTKSLSLPYRTSPIHGPEESDYEEDTEEDEGVDYSSDEDDSMFAKSLPCDFFLKDMSGSEPDADRTDRCTLDGADVHQLQISEDTDSRPLNVELSGQNMSADGEQRQEEVKEKEENTRIEEKEVTGNEEEVQQGKDQLQSESSATEEEDCSVVKDTQSDEERTSSPHSCAEFPLQSDEDSSTLNSITVQSEEKAGVEDSHSDSPEEETAADPSDEFDDFSVRVPEELRSCVREHVKERDIDEEEGRHECKEKEGMCGEMVEGIEESDESMSGDGNERGMREGGEEEESAIQDDFIYKVIEDEKSTEDKVERESTDGEDEEQIEETSGGKEVQEEGTIETEVSIEEELESTGDKLTDQEVQKGREELETNIPKTSELEEESEGQKVIINDALHHDREKAEEVHDKKMYDNQCITIRSLDKELKDITSDMRELKEVRICQDSDSRKGGVGRKIVISKQPKFYQVKAVPVVPPKPQHCKITAMNLRHQHQKEREYTCKVPTDWDKETDGAPEEEDGEGNKEKPVLRRERRSYAEGESLIRDLNRNSPLSMNFEEAVAIAAMKQKMEKECEKEKERQRDWGNEVQ